VKAFGKPMCGAVSDKRTGLSFIAVILSDTRHLYLKFYLSACYIIGFGWRLEAVFVTMATPTELTTANYFSLILFV
jgi:hypothetical protein